MAAVFKLHLSPQTFLHHLTFRDPSLSHHPPKLRPLQRRNPGKTDGRDFLLGCNSIWKIPSHHDKHHDKHGSHTCRWIPVVSTRGLRKALAREFLLSGDRVVVASHSPESVHTTVGELEEDLKKGILTAGSMSKRHMARAKVVGITCDVCEPEDARKLANFAASELGSIDTWINNAGTNKGFRPLLQFTGEDIDQVSVS